MFYKLNLTAKYVQKLTRKISLETKSSFKLAYYCTNNMAEFWMVEHTAPSILLLRITLRWGL